MKAYLQAFIHFKQNNLAKLLPMAKFAYNNTKNGSTGHTPFELNYGYPLRIFFEEDINSRYRSKTTNKLLAKLWGLMTVCQENLHYAQKLQKRAHDKGVQPRSYAISDKVWLNSKYIIMKQNRKLEAKFLRPFRVLHLVGKQAYKLKLPKKWRIHKVFHVLRREQDNTRKERVDKNVTQLEFDAGNSKEYKVEVIQDSTVYAMESESSHLPGLYYLIAWKGYPKEENS